MMLEWCLECKVKPAKKDSQTPQFCSEECFKIHLRRGLEEGLEEMVNQPLDKWDKLLVILSAIGFAGGMYLIITMPELFGLSP